MKQLTDLTFVELQAELKTIPEEYQSLVRETIEDEIQEGGHDATDADRLAYLRQRLQDIQNGAYIDPIGKTKLITAAHPDDIYNAEGVDSMAGDSDTQAKQAERKGNLIKLAAIVGVAIFFFLFVSLSARNRAKAEELSESDLIQTPTADAADMSVGTVVTATPENIGMADGSSSLSAIGSLGATLKIGRPAVIEIHLNETEEVVALAVDPARLSKRGELPFNDKTMASDDPVAVWVHGTVVNYAMGIPHKFAQSLQAGDTILLSTDTGQNMRFVVIDTPVGNTYDAPHHLSQDRIGMTLFSLPAPAKDDVQFILANYDTRIEDSQVFTSNKIGEDVQLTDEIMFAVSPDMDINHTTDGLVTIQVSGMITQEIGSLDHLSLSLTNAAGEQTPSTNLSHHNNQWVTEFTVTDSFLGADAFAQVRAIPANDLETIYLGHLPPLRDHLKIMFSDAYWLPETRQGVIHLHVENEGLSTVRLDPAYFSLLGGDAQQIFTTQPALPILLDSQEEIFIELSFLVPHRQQTPNTSILKTGDLRWEIPFVPSN